VQQFTSIYLAFS